MEEVTKKLANDIIEKIKKNIIPPRYETMKKIYNKIMKKDEEKNYNDLKRIIEGILNRKENSEISTTVTLNYENTNSNSQNESIKTNSAFDSSSNRLPNSDSNPPMEIEGDNIMHQNEGAIENLVEQIYSIVDKKKINVELFLTIIFKETV